MPKFVCWSFNTQILVWLAFRSTGTWEVTQIRKAMKVRLSRMELMTL